MKKSELLFQSNSWKSTIDFMEQHPTLTFFIFSIFFAVIFVNLLGCEARNK